MAKNDYTEGNGKNKNDQLRSALAKIAEHVTRAVENRSLRQRKEAG